ncbi:MAG: hypothetical protein JW830_11420 [Bacteroidales bacterium]|nr:hypothetical protein [Bacteroidales bacterium]
MSSANSLSFLISSVFLLLLVTSQSCDRDQLDPDPDARPSFSHDTITFDTVFTAIGSATRSFKVYNRSNRPMVINSIALAGGSDSFFRINLDGVSSPEQNNIEIPPDDSLFIFIAVTVDPTNSDNPVVIKDSLVFNTRGSLQDVKLIAYGQDVHLISGDIIDTQTWTREKPYLIYNSMAVDTGQVLTIEAGTRIFFHRNSSMIIWGRLLVNGTGENPVVFQNDRLEEFYEIIAGQWGTIYIDPISQGNKINHAIIKNGVAGIQIGYPSDFQVPELELTNSIILNHSFAGIYAFGAYLTCYNTVIANCAGAALALLRGGSYRFWHCTVSNNGVIGSSRSGPSVVLSNIFYNPEYDEASGKTIYVPRSGDLEEADFVNSILYGNLGHELQFIHNQSDLFNYTFDHCLVKASEDSINSSNQEHFTDIILNKDAFFINDSDRYHLDYRLDTLSPAKDAGNPTLLETYPYLEPDREGISRNGDGMPDLGAFERKED